MQSRIACLSTSCRTCASYPSSMAPPWACVPVVTVSTIPTPRAAPPRSVERDDEAAAAAAGLEPTVGVRRSLGRERLGDPQRQLPGLDEPDELAQLLLLEVV